MRHADSNTFIINSARTSAYSCSLSLTHTHLPLNTLALSPGGRTTHNFAGTKMRTPLLKQHNIVTTYRKKGNALRWRLCIRTPI